jgi:hypothetical protein
MMPPQTARKPLEGPITKAQIQAIKVGQQQLAIDDDTYREMLSLRYGKKSCKTLTKNEAADLIDSLNRRGARIRKKFERRKRTSAGVDRLISPGQRRLISALDAQIDWISEDGLTRWCAASFGFDYPKTGKQAAKVIEGLKAMLKRQPPSSSTGEGLGGGGE